MAGTETVTPRRRPLTADAGMTRSVSAAARSQTRLFETWWLLTCRAACAGMTRRADRRRPVHPATRAAPLMPIQVDCAICRPTSLLSEPECRHGSGDSRREIVDGLDVERRKTTTDGGVNEPADEALSAIRSAQESGGTAPQIAYDARSCETGPVRPVHEEQLWPRKR